MLKRDELKGLFKRLFKGEKYIDVLKTTSPKNNNVLALHN